MKVEKINNNKAIIVLTLDELAKRKITLNDIKKGSNNVQDFFFEVLADTDITSGFEDEASQLFVEVSTAENDILMITITKADCIPDLSSFNKSSKSDLVAYTVSSNLYSFDSPKTLYCFCKKALEENLYVGSNSLYKFNNKYFLLFSKSTIKRFDFVKTFSVISEYADKYFSKQTTAFLEYAEQIVVKNAIQTLQNI